MSNSIGNNIILTLFGESHGPMIGACLDGMTPGIKVDEEFINSQLAKRRPSGNIETARVEKDNYQIISGVFNGFTTGAPICIIIPNENIRSCDYEKIKGIARPSHADYAAFAKYHGFEDYRGGGHFSGRLTTPIVALGAICLKALENKNIKIGTHILKCGGILDQEFMNYDEEIDSLNNKDFPVISDIKEQVANEIFKAKMDNDSLGGIIQTAISNLPTGVGEPWFDSFEGVIAKAVFSIGSVKGIEFGKGFDFADYRGSEVNDEFAIKDDKIITTTNNNGGINGGITNGMPVVFNSVIKPTPSIERLQKTVNFLTNEETSLLIEGRHDPAIIRRICIVITSITAIVTCDMLVQRFGTDYLK